MEKIGVLGLYGSSGNKYQFEIHPFGTELQEIAAVYAVTRRYMDDDNEYRHSVLFIGKTDNLLKTFTNHKKKPCLKENNANCLCIHKDENIQSRKRKANDLIDRIKPKCNE